MYLPLVSIIILNYNGGELFINCLESVLASKYPFFQVIVVDNASTDKSLETAKLMFHNAKNVVFIANNKNLGFCVGNNIGIKHALGEHVILLNDDVVVTSDWLSELVKEARKHHNGFYVPKILLLDRQNTLESVGNEIHFSGIGFSRGLGELDRNQHNIVEEIAYAGGACLFVSKKTIKEIGLLDPVYFAFNEDTDWCWRGRMFGIKSYCVPSAIIYHKWGGSFGLMSKNKFYYVERNRLLTVLKNYSRRTLLLFLPIFLLIEIATFFYAFDNRMMGEKIKAYSDVIRLKGYIEQQRSFLQKNRRFSDKEVTRVFSDRINHVLLKSPAFNVLNHIVKFLVNILRPLIR